MNVELLLGWCVARLEDRTWPQARILATRRECGAFGSTTPLRKDVHAQGIRPWDGRRHATSVDAARLNGWDIQHNPYSASPAGWDGLKIHRCPPPTLLFYWIMLVKPWAGDVERFNFIHYHAITVVRRHA